MLRKISIVLLPFAVLAVGAIVWAGCKPGNTPYVNEQGTEEWCCVPVGDGSVLSCTDGDDWFNVYPIESVSP